MLFWASSLLLSLQPQRNLVLRQCTTQYNRMIIAIANITLNYAPLLIWNCQSLEAHIPKVRFLTSTYRYQSQNYLITEGIKHLQVVLKAAGWLGFPQQLLNQYNTLLSVNIWSRAVYLLAIYLAWAETGWHGPPPSAPMAMPEAVRLLHQVPK